LSESQAAIQQYNFISFKSVHFFGETTNFDQVDGVCISQGSAVTFSGMVASVLCQETG